MVKSKKIFTEKIQKRFFLFLFDSSSTQFCMQNKNKKDILNKYFPQIYLEECEYKEKKAKERHIKGNIVIPDSGKNDDESIK